MNQTKLFCGAAVILLILPLIVMNPAGYAFFGFGNKPAPQYAQIEGNMQTVAMIVQPQAYAPIVVQKGIAVRWLIKVTAANLNSCNHIVVIPKYQIRKNLQAGENIIEFTPRETGEIPYSCQMGMIKNKIKVVDDLGKEKT